MARDLQPDQVLARLDKGRLDPFYLFYGAAEFLLEMVLDRIRAGFIPEGLRDFNQEVLYGDKKLDPEEIVGRASSMPFMSSNRLIIVRRTEAMSSNQLERLIPYLERPADTTCLIFVSSKVNFRTKFYKTVREAGLAVSFDELKGKRLEEWIRRAARERGMELEPEACHILQEIVGNRLRELDGELEKLFIRHGSGSRIGEEEVRELAVQSRSFTIFELVEMVSAKDAAGALSVLARYLEEEGRREAALGIVGMLNRQVRLLWQAGVLAGLGKGAEEIARELGVPPFVGVRLRSQLSNWSEEDLEKALIALYETDGFLKSGSGANVVLESLVVSLCG